MSATAAQPRRIGVDAFCVTAKRQVFAAGDHLGRVICPACGEQVKPVVVKEPR